MRRIVTGVRDYFSELGAAVRRGWDRFFFTPADPTALGLIRMVVGALLFWSLLVLGLDLRGFLGPDGWAARDAVREYLAERAPLAWSFWFWVPPGMLRLTWGACLVVLGAYALGYRSRVTAVLAWIIAVSTARRAPMVLFGFDQVVSTWALYLAACGASGQAVSLDRLIARRRLARQALARRLPPGGPFPVPGGTPEPTVSANLGLRLIQLHLCLIYGMAGLAKLRGEAWWTGFAVWGVLAAGEFRRFNLTGLAAYPLILNVMTHAGLAFELLYPALIWVRVLRPLLLGYAVLLHLGIDLSLGLTEFGLVMLAGNLAFVPGRWLRSLVAGREVDQPAGTVLYDGACPRCRSAVGWIAAADPDRVVRPVDLTAIDVHTIHPALNADACMKAMHLVGRDGRVWAGYDAMVRLARWLPWFWGLGLVGSLPVVAPVGRRFYNAVAARRAREAVSCTDEVCEVPAAGAAGRSRPR